MFPYKPLKILTMDKSNVINTNTKYPYIYVILNIYKIYTHQVIYS